MSSSSSSDVPDNEIHDVSLSAAGAMAAAAAAPAAPQITNDEMAPPPRQQQPQQQQQQQQQHQRPDGNDRNSNDKKRSNSDYHDNLDSPDINGGGTSSGGNSRKQPSSSIKRFKPDEETAKDASGAATSSSAISESSLDSTRQVQESHTGPAAAASSTSSSSSSSSASGPAQAPRGQQGTTSGARSSASSSSTGQMMDQEEVNLEELFEDVDVDEVDNEEELVRRIMAAAAARGIPLEFIMSRAGRGGAANDDDDDDEPVEYPFDSPPRSLQDVAEFIKSDKCQKVLILAGAGMSVASGIPDFRSSNGLYATLDASSLSTTTVEQYERIRLDPSYCLDQHLFLENPLPCLEVNREFILGTQLRKWKATLAHRLVEGLAKHNKLCRLYTQNIDGLEDQLYPNLSHSQRIAVHGSMDEASCAACGAVYPFDEFCLKMKQQIKDITGQDPEAPQESTAITCPSCGRPTVKPSIVLFRSSLPQEFFQKVPHDTRDVDLLIVIGTSLHVAPANSLVWRVPKSAMRVLINREPVGWHLGLDYESNDRDYFAQGNCEDVVLDLMELLGWLDIRTNDDNDDDDDDNTSSNFMKPVAENPSQYLPQSSATLLQERLQRRAAQQQQQQQQHHHRHHHQEQNKEPQQQQEQSQSQQDGRKKEEEEQKQQQQKQSQEGEQTKTTEQRPVDTTESTTIPINSQTVPEKKL